jgi:hypothetical protein
MKEQNEAGSKQQHQHQQYQHNNMHPITAANRERLFTTTTSSLHHRSIPWQK